MSTSTSKTGKSRLSRLLPKFLRGDKNTKTDGGIDSKTPYCFIHLLDDSNHQIQIKGNWKGSQLQDKVCELLNLHEKDYFGLRFIDSLGQTHWLDGNKSLSSQFKGCQTPHTLYFGVKFYAADPCKLREEITRYLFFLQVKQDILQGRLPVTFDEAAELCAYAVQSDLGDFDPRQHTDGYVSEFCFIPNQTEELERRILALHRRLGGLVPLMAEYRYLDKVKWLDMYGVDLHPVMGEGSVEYFLGLTPTGIVVYKNKNKVGNYFWPRINKVTFKGKIFIVKVKDKNNEEHVYAFELPRKTACKHLWKCCVEHHAFFRLNQTQERSTRENRVLRSVSTNRRSGRSERQAVSDNLSRHPSNVNRLPSRRQPRRVSSDSRINSQESYESQYDRDTGMVTMMIRPEPVRAPRHRSLPELQGHESPHSTKSAPWEQNFDCGLYTHGKDSPVSERSNRMREQRNRVLAGSDSESGISQRRKYFPNRRGSDNDSDVSVTRRRRRDIDSDSASDVSSRYPASQGHNERSKSGFPLLYPFHDKENRPNGSIPSLHSAPAGEAKQRRRRRRSKSPSKRPPEELRQHFEYDLKDTDGLSVEELKEIPFVNVQTKASLFKLKYSPKLRQKVKAAKQKSLGDLDQNRNRSMKKTTSSTFGDEFERDMSVHSQPLPSTDKRDREATGYNQSMVDHRRVSRRPISYHYSPTESACNDSSSLPRVSHQPHSDSTNPHPQITDSDVDSRVNTECDAKKDAYSRVPSQVSHGSSQVLRGSSQPVSQIDQSLHSRQTANTGIKLESLADSVHTPQNGQSSYDNYVSLCNPSLGYQKETPLPKVTAENSTDKSSFDSVAVSTQPSKSSRGLSKSYHSDHEPSRRHYATFNSSSRSHRSHHHQSLNHAQSRSQVPYKHESTSTVRRRRDEHHQDQGDHIQTSLSRNEGQYRQGRGPDRDGHHPGDTGDLEYERLHLQPAPSSSLGEGARSGQKGEGYPAAGSYNYREGAETQARYSSQPSSSRTYDLRSHGNNLSYSSVTSPPKNYHQYSQQPAAQRSVGTFSSYGSPNQASPHHPEAHGGQYDQVQRPRSFVQDDPRSRPHQGYGPFEEAGRLQVQNQEVDQRSRYRDEGDRSRHSVHDVRPARPPRIPGPGDSQHQYDYHDRSGFQQNTPNYQNPSPYRQPSPHAQYQNTLSKASPQRSQGTPPRYQGSPLRNQGTPPRYQGAASRQSISNTPPRQSMDPRYSQGLMSVHARQQSEGSSSQASVRGGSSFHRSPRPSPAASMSDHSAGRSLGNSLSSDQAQQLMRSTNYNPDLCTEL